VTSNIGEVVLGVGNPDLAVTGTVPSSVSSGSNVTYKLTATNNGSGPATGVKLSDLLPPDATFVSATGGITPSSGVLTFTIGSLAAGASSTVSVVVTPHLPGLVADRAMVAMDQTDPTPGDNSVMLTTNVVSFGADLVLTGAAPSTATPHEDFGYTFTVTNGGMAEATGVKLTETLSGNTTFLSSHGGTLSRIGSNLVFNLGNLAAGAATKVIVFVNVLKTLGGLVTNASVTMDHSDPTPKDNSVSLKTRGAGVHGTGCTHVSTVLLLAFPEPVDPAWAQNTNNYHLVDLQGTRRTVLLKSARYDTAANTVTLKPLHQQNLHRLYQLTVIGAGATSVTDTKTGPADAQTFPGDPNGNLVMLITIADLIDRGTSPTSLRNYKLILHAQHLEMKRLGLE
jgi:uncharacterized repeat protein (TIGR01451 family)